MFMVNGVADGGDRHEVENATMLCLRSAAVPPQRDSSSRLSVVSARPCRLGLLDPARHRSLGQSQVLGHLDRAVSEPRSVRRRGPVTWALQRASAAW